MHTSFKVRVGEKLLSPQTAVIAHGTLETRHVTSRRTLLDPRENFVFALGQPINVVDEMSERNFRRCLLSEKTA